MKKVLLIIPHRSGKGGVASYWNGLIPHLEEKELDLTIFEMGGQTGGGILHYFTDQFKLWKLLISENFDLAHLNPSLDVRSFIRELLFIAALRIRVVPFMITFHGWEVPLATKIQNHFKWLVRITYLKARLINVLSTQFVEPIKEWGYQGVIQVHTTCVDTNLVQSVSVRAKILTPDSRIRLLYISRIVKSKGVLEAIKAVEPLVSKYNVELTIAGDGPFYDEMEQYVTSNKLSFVRLMGYVTGEQKMQLFATHHLLCFPTYYPEGLPVSILEGISTGCVLVCTAVGGISDVFLDGKMGSICTPDIEDIFNKLEHWVKDVNAMNRVMDFNYEYGKNHFGSDVIASSIYKQYTSDLCG
ncbi:MAG: glycosyltransferase [Flavobacteriales bacterium]|nr:glycosyltransferase [Flavobacteriales bacterium]